MLNQAAIKQLTKMSGEPVNKFLALGSNNDPFYADVDYRVRSGEWFGALWNSGHQGHLRRIHYRLVSQKEPIITPTGRKYDNTPSDWVYLCWASLNARYLDLIPFDAIPDHRNDEPMVFAGEPLDPNEEREVSCGLYDDATIFTVPDPPELPSVEVDGLGAGATRQDYIVEVWIEKSTQNDWLVPLCERRGVNLVVGIGEQSETRSRQLAERAAKYCVPTRIIYLSDFDFAGRSMPKAVARKVEFTLAKFSLDADLQLIPLLLTPDQIQRYELPRKPMDRGGGRKDKFERIFGVGSTELDAMEALHPGEMARLLEAEIDNFLDPKLGARVSKLRSEQSLKLQMINRAVYAEHAEEIKALRERFDEIVEELRDWESEADDLWSTMSTELEEQQPDLSDVEIPRSEAPGETDSFVLFDSKRDYFTQMDSYNAWNDGEEAADA